MLQSQRALQTQQRQSLGDPKDKGGDKRREEMRAVEVRKTVYSQVMRLSPLSYLDAAKDRPEEDDFASTVSSGCSPVAATVMVLAAMPIHIRSRTEIALLVMSRSCGCADCDLTSAVYRTVILHSRHAADPVADAYYCSQQGGQKRPLGISKHFRRSAALPS
jgi:hypothetical protein